MKTADAAVSTPKPLSAASRSLSLVEFLVGGAIVIGHNVFHVVPNEVPILFVLALISIRLREGSFGAVGLGRPKSWAVTILFAVATSVTILCMQIFITEPLAQKLGLQATKSAMQSLHLKSGDIWSLVKALAIIWTFAAFGEEISYRRYLLGRAADVGNRTNVAYWASLIFVSVLFGFGHYYQGRAGVFTSSCDGFVMGAAYILSRRNLWVTVLAHGLHDTTAFVLVFLGLAN